MHIHALQTGRVQVKRAQLVGQGHGLRRRLAPLVAWPTKARMLIGPVSQAAKPLRLLLIEDEPHMARLIAANIGDTGYVATGAGGETRISCVASSLLRWVDMPSAPNGFCKRWPLMQLWPSITQIWRGPLEA